MSYQEQCERSRDERGAGRPVGDPLSARQDASLTLTCLRELLAQWIERLRSRHG